MNIRGCRYAGGAHRPPHRVLHDADHGHRALFFGGEGARVVDPRDQSLARLRRAAVHLAPGEDRHVRRENALGATGHDEERAARHLRDGDAETLGDQGRVGHGGEPATPVVDAAVAFRLAEYADDLGGIDGAGDDEVPETGHVVGGEGWNAMDLDTVHVSLLHVEGWRG